MNWISQECPVVCSELPRDQGRSRVVRELKMIELDKRARSDNHPVCVRFHVASSAGFAVAHCVPQHSPSPLSSPSPPSSGSGSTGRCDSVTASTISAQSPTGGTHVFLQTNDMQMCDDKAHSTVKKIAIHNSVNSLRLRCSEQSICALLVHIHTFLTHLRCNYIRKPPKPH